MKTLLYFQTGSRSYNVNTADSDFDTLRVVLFNPDEMFALHNFSPAGQKISGDNDESYVEFRAYITRIIQGNPTYVQTLFDWLFNLLEGYTTLNMSYKLRQLLVRDKVHNAFFGVATRMFKEWQRTGKNKCAGEALRYLMMLEQLHSTGVASVCLTGVKQKMVLNLRSGNFDPKEFEEVFTELKEECDRACLKSRLSNDVDAAYAMGNELAQQVYKEYFGEVLTGK